MITVAFVHILIEHSKQFPGNEMLTEIAMPFISLFHDVYYFGIKFVTLFSFPTYVILQSEFQNSPGGTTLQRWP